MSTAILTASGVASWRWRSGRCGVVFCSNSILLQPIKAQIYGIRNEALLLTPLGPLSEASAFWSRSGVQAQAYGRGSSGRSGRGPGFGGRGRGRTVGLPGSPPGDPYGLRDLPDLPSLAALVERHVGMWAATKDVAVLRAAFNKLGWLGTARGADPALARSTMRRLAAAYLPLVPRLRDAYSCVGPLWTCAKLGFWEGGLAEELLRRLREGQLLQGANGQGHANLWWAVSEAPGNVVGLAAEALQSSGKCLVRMPAGNLDPQDCSNLLLACARLQWGDDTALLHHTTACLASKSDPDNQHLANTIYALGELAEDCRHDPRPEDLQLLAEQVVARLGRNGEERQTGSQPKYGGFTPQALSNMLLGCAKLGYRQSTLLQPLVAAAGKAAPRMTNQGLANSLYALAKLGCMEGNDFQPLWAEVRQRLQRAPDSFVPQELSNMLWALAILRQLDREEEACVLAADKEQCAGALAAECRRRNFTGFKPQGFSNSVWALASMGWSKDQGWYEAAVKAAMQPAAVTSAKPQDWSNLLYGLALVRHRPPDGLLEAIAAVGPLVTLRILTKSQECSNLLWSQAVLGLYEQRLVDVLVERLGQLLRGDRAQLTGQELANSLWALAVMGPDVLHRHSGLVEGLLREALRRWKDAATSGQQGRTSPFAQEALAQLWHVRWELRCIGERWLMDLNNEFGERGLTTAGAGSKGSLLAAARWAAEAERHRALDGRSTRLQQQVVGCLERLVGRLTEDPRGGAVRGGSCGEGAEPPVCAEYLVEGLCRRVDVVVTLPGGRRVAVEVDGPWHFLANHPHKRTKDGPTQLRDRQLEGVFGVGNVMSVPYWEWDELRSDKAREDYLYRLLGLKVAS